MPAEPKRVEIVYISAPYASNPAFNTRRVLKVAELIRDYGHIPIVPHYSLFDNLVSYHDWDYWMEQCLKTISHLNLTLMISLTGTSIGTIKEIELAESLDIPIFKNVDLYETAEAMDYLSLDYRNKETHNFLRYLGGDVKIFPIGRDRDDRKQMKV